MKHPLFGLLAAAAVGAAVLLAAPAPVSASEKPDVTSRGGLKIGTVLVPWGSPAAVALKPAEAIQPGAQACAFNATYEMTNLGNVAAAPPFVNRLRIDGATVAATNSGLTLGAHETKSITTAPYLPLGEHTIELSLDDDAGVAESRKDNNRFKVRYALKAPCGAPPPAPPAAGKR
jgi:hypothetical protein